MWRKATALFICLVLALGAFPAAAQDSTAYVAGVILDPDGAPARGFKVVLRDTESGKTFESLPTDADGNYSAKVPLGGRYKIDYVVASDGVTQLPVQDVPPVNVLVAGTTRVNVRFTAPPVATNSAPSSTSPPPGNTKTKKPWYKRPGPIVGLVLGAGAVAALVIGGGSSSSSTPASPSTPP